MDKNCSGHVCVKENQIETSSQINKIFKINKESQISNQIRKINEKLNKKVGISLIALVITIIIIIILAAIVMMSSVNTVDSASYAKFAHEISEIQTSTDAQRAKNAANGPGEENRNKGFTKVAIENPPDSFVSFDDDAITGYWVDLDFIDMKDIKTGREELIAKRVTFGREDVYVYDYEGKVYYAKGYPDDDGRIHYKVDEVESNIGNVAPPTISKIEYELSADKQSAIVTVIAIPANGGELTVTGGGKTATKTGENTYQLVIDRNGTIQITVKENGGNKSTQSLTISGIEVKAEYTISYNANGGSGAPSSHKVTEGETTQISNSKPNREGYEFKGWATSQTSANNGNVVFSGGESYVGNGDLTLYAVWESISVEVSSLTASNISNQTYTGSEIRPEPTVKDGSKTLTLNTHYTLSYSNNTNAGTATITITGKGNYVGSKTVTFEIVEANMSGIKVIEYEGEYDGEAHGIEIELTGTSQGAIVKYGTAAGSCTQTISPRYTEVGTYTIYFELSKENYNSEKGSAIVKINAITMDTSGSVEASKRITISSVPNQEYTGSEIRPEPAVKYGSKTLTKDTDYTLGYSNNTNVGTATITVTGKGNYAGTVSTTFEIVNVSMTGITSEGFDGEYDGSAHGIKVNLSGSSVGASVSYGTTKGSYTQSTSPTYTNAGTYTVYYQVTKTNYDAVEGEEVVRITKRTMNDSESVDESKRITVSEIADQTYVASAIKPEPTVKYGETTLVLNRDYTLEYNNNTNVGNATITVTGTGNYSGTVEATFEIKLVAGTEFDVILTQDTYTYDGTAKEPEVTVKTTVNNKEVTLTPADYEVTYSGNTNTNSATNKPTITVTGKGNFAGVSKTVEFTIESQGMTAENTTIEVGTPEYTYDGEAKTPTVSVEVDGKALVEGTDYTVGYENNTTVGEATVTITGIGNYAGTITESFTIVNAEMTGITVTGYESVYDGLAHGITITGVTSGEDGAIIKYGTTQGTYDLTENPTYTDVDEYVVYYEITKPNYNTVTGSETVTINKKSVATVWSDLELEYTGSKLKPTATATGITGETINLTVTSDAENVGTYQATAEIDTVTNGSKENYELTNTTTNFTIKATDAAFSVSLETSTFEYDGTAHTPKVTVTANGKTLTEDTDFTVEYSNNTNYGTATVTITGKGNYSGTITRTFSITGATPSISLTPKTATYTGSVIEIGEATISGVSDDLAPTGNVTYTYYTDSNCATKTPTSTGASAEGGAPVNAGTYYVKASIAAEGNYATKTSSAVKLTISPKSISSATISAISEQTWSGSEIKPTPTVTDGSTALVNNTDYTLSYSNNNAAGTGTVTVTGKENYTGTISVNFTIVAKTYAITYDANDGSLGEVPSSENKSHGTAYTITSKEPTRAGYIFLGWSTNKNATEATYVGGDSYTTNSDITLYAVWKMDGIKYDANGGRFDTGTTNIVKYETVISEAVTKTSKTSNVSADGTTADTSTGYGNNQSTTDVITIPGADKLEVTITYATESTSYDWVCLYDTSVTPSSSNYSSSITGKLGGTTKTTKTYTIEGDTVQIYFKSDSSVCSYYGYYAEIKFDGVVTTAVRGEYKEPTREAGYAIAGWSTDKNATTAEYELGEENAPEGNATLYAVWTKVMDLIPSIANTPVLGTGMQAVYWSDENASQELTATTYTSAMYNYTLGDGKTDSKENKWANAKTTEDGSYWVWIPRYAYKITYTNEKHNVLSTDSRAYGNIDILFMYGTSDTHYRDLNGEKQLLPEGYKVHPAFQAMTTTTDLATNPLGKWDSELEGIWVAKYEASMEQSTDGSTWRAKIVSLESEGNVLTTNAGNTSSTQIRMVSKPSVRSWGFVNPSNMYANSEKMYEDLGSHQMKSSEWGAAAYLTYSAYGRNGNELSVNQCHDAYTGGGPGIGTSTIYNSYYSYESSTFASTYAWNTTRGKLASTTGNIYGIYDMSGGSWEYVASYINNGNEYLASNGTSLLNSSNLRNKQIYAVGSSDNWQDNYKANSGVYGDAVYETSTSGTKNTSWCNDESTYPDDDMPFLTRSGNVADNSEAGVFFFSYGRGGMHRFDSFRPVLCFTSGT